MLPQWWDYWGGYEAPWPSQGSATTLPTEPENDVIADLHKVVEEVTGSPVERPVRPRMGFL